MQTGEYVQAGEEAQAGEEDEAQLQVFRPTWGGQRPWSETRPHPQTSDRQCWWCVPLAEEEEVLDDSAWREMPW